MIRVLIVDDHPIVREGLTAVLDREPDIEVVAVAASVADGISRAAATHPDLILLDLKLPGADEAGSVAQFAGGPSPVLVFTAYDSDDDVFRAIRDGARGYLLKGSPASEVAHAIRQVHAGESYLSPRIAATLVKDVARPRGAPAALSPRERAVLRLVAAGLSNRQIGGTLSISERTVKFHVTAILNKLGADNRAQAVALAAERGLLSSS